VTQGEIWSADLDPIQRNEQAGTRLVLIVSGDIMNTHMNLVMICPLTTSIKNFEGCVVLEKNKENNLKQSSEILVFQLRTLSKTRLKKWIGKVPPSVIRNVHEQLMNFIIL
jgi:mRNA interferase MazF